MRELAQVGARSKLISYADVIPQSVRRTHPQVVWLPTRAEALDADGTIVNLTAVSRGNVVTHRA